MSVNIENLIKIIVCPITKTKLTYNKENNDHTESIALGELVKKQG